MTLAAIAQDYDSLKSSLARCVGGEYYPLNLLSSPIRDFSLDPDLLRMKRDVAVSTGLKLVGIHDAIEAYSRRSTILCMKRESDCPQVNHGWVS